MADDLELFKAALKEDQKATEAKAFEDSLRQQYANVPQEEQAKQAEAFDKIMEGNFRGWYGQVVADRNRMGAPLNPDPDDPLHHYDYRALFYSGKPPLNETGHFPSEYKTDESPERFKNWDPTTGQEDPSLPLYDTKNSRPATDEEKGVYEFKQALQQDALKPLDTAGKAELLRKAGVTIPKTLNYGFKGSEMLLPGVGMHPSPRGPFAAQAEKQNDDPTHIVDELFRRTFGTNKPDQGTATQIEKRLALRDLARERSKSAAEIMHDEAKANLENAPWYTKLGFQVMNLAKSAADAVPFTTLIEEGIGQVFGRKPGETVAGAAKVQGVTHETMPVASAFTGATGSAVGTILGMGTKIPQLIAYSVAKGIEPHVAGIPTEKGLEKPKDTSVAGDITRELVSNATTLGALRFIAPGVGKAVAERALKAVEAGTLSPLAAKALQGAAGGITATTVLQLVPHMTADGLQVDLSEWKTDPAKAAARLAGNALVFSAHQAVDKSVASAAEKAAAKAELNRLAQNEQAPPRGSVEISPPGGIYGGQQIVDEHGNPVEPNTPEEVMRQAEEDAIAGSGDPVEATHPDQGPVIGDPVKTPSGSRGVITAVADVPVDPMRPNGPKKTMARVTLDTDEKVILPYEILDHAGDAPSPLERVLLPEAGGVGQRITLHPILEKRANRLDILYGEKKSEVDGNIDFNEHFKKSQDLFDEGANHETFLEKMKEGGLSPEEAEAFWQMHMTANAGHEDIANAGDLRTPEEKAAQEAAQANPGPLGTPLDKRREERLDMERRQRVFDKAPVVTPVNINEGRNIGRLLSEGDTVTDHEGTKWTVKGNELISEGKDPIRLRGNDGEPTNRAVFQVLASVKELVKAADTTPPVEPPEDILAQRMMRVRDARERGKIKLDEQSDWDRLETKADDILKSVPNIDRKLFIEILTHENVDESHPLHLSDREAGAMYDLKKADQATPAAPEDPKAKALDELDTIFKAPTTESTPTETKIEPYRVVTRDGIRGTAVAKVEGPDGKEHVKIETDDGKVVTYPKSDTRRGTSTRGGITVDIDPWKRDGPGAGERGAVNLTPAPGSLADRAIKEVRGMFKGLRNIARETVEWFPGRGLESILRSSEKYEQDHPDNKLPTSYEEAVRHSGIDHIVNTLKRQETPDEVKRRVDTAKARGDYESPKPRKVLDIDALFQYINTNAPEVLKNAPDWAKNAWAERGLNLVDGKAVVDGKTLRDFINGVWGGGRGEAATDLLRATGLSKVVDALAREGLAYRIKDTLESGKLSPVEEADLAAKRRNKWVKFREVFPTEASIEEVDGERAISVGPADLARGGSSLYVDKEGAEIEGQSVLIHPKVAQELKALAELNPVERGAGGVAGAGATFSTWLQTKGPVDMLSHGINLTAEGVKLGATGILKTAKALFWDAFKYREGTQAREELQRELAKAGISRSLHEHFDRGTLTSRFEELASKGTGFKYIQNWILNNYDMAMRKLGLDVANSRINKVNEVRAKKGLEPLSETQQIKIRRDIGLRFGNYNPRTQDVGTRWLKKWEIQPFVVAAKTMTANAYRASPIGVGVSLVKGEGKEALRRFGGMAALWGSQLASAGAWNALHGQQPFPANIPMGSYYTGEDEDGRPTFITWPARITGAWQAMRYTGFQPFLEQWLSDNKIPILNPEGLQVGMPDDGGTASRAGGMVLGRLYHTIAGPLPHLALAASGADMGPGSRMLFKPTAEDFQGAFEEGGSIVQAWNSMTEGDTKGVIKAFFGQFYSARGLSEMDAELRKLGFGDVIKESDRIVRQAKDQSRDKREAWIQAELDKHQDWEPEKLGPLIEKTWRRINMWENRGNESADEPKVTLEDFLKKGVMDVARSVAIELGDKNAATVKARSDAMQQWMLNQLNTHPEWSTMKPDEKVALWKKVWDWIKQQPEPARGK